MSLVRAGAPGALGRAPLRGVTHEAPLMAAMLVGQGRSMANYHRINLPHLGGVRLRPGPPEVVDLVEWAVTC